jgi:drug/metabolite transporter (DMT)-like permease
VLTVLAEIVVFRARVSWHTVAGVVLSVIGVVFVVGRPALSGDASSLLGDLFMFGACICWVVYNFLSRDLHKRLSDIAITAYQALFGTAFLVPLALLEMHQWVPITLAAGFSLAYLAVFCSALSNFLYVYALSRLGPVTVTPSINLIPMVGVIGGVAILGERISWVQIVGGIVIIAGVLLVNRKPARSSQSEG